jgi:hypothetical protein
MKLHPVNRVKGGNRFCGPAVISAITGMTTCEASRLIRNQTGRKMVTGTGTAEMLNALYECGVSMKHIALYAGTRPSPTITGWLRESKAIRTPGRVFLVATSNHWQLISGRKFVCGKTVEVVSIRHEKVKRRARVQNVYELTTKGITIPHNLLTAPKRENPLAHFHKPELKELRRIAAEHGIQIDHDSDHDFLEVYPPDGLFVDEENDPYDDNHYAYGTDDLRERVTVYAELIRDAKLGAAGNVCAAVHTSAQMQ